MKRGFRRRVLDRVDGLADSLGHLAGHVEDDFVHFRAGQLDVGDRFAVSEDDGARRDPIDLAEPVRDHHDARAVGAKPAQVLEEAFDLGVVQRCGHFVEQEVVRLPGHGLHDLDHAEDRGREVRRVFGESTGDAEPVEKGLDEGLVRLFVDRAVALLEEVAQHHVLIDGHEGQETEFLIGDGDLQGARDVAAADPAGRAVDGDCPRIMAHRSPEDLDQGGFPGAVGSQQGDDLAPVNVEGSVAQGLHHSERLADALHLQHDACTPSIP